MMAGSQKGRWWALAGLAVALIVASLDLTVLNLALPTIAVSLHASTGDLQWIVDSYSLVVAAMLLPGGLLGDRFGRKRMLLISLVLFGLASLTCAFANSPGTLIAARAVLGVGAASLVPLSLGVVPAMFGEQERSRAVTILLSSTVVALPIGPIFGGWLLTHFWWGSVFLINIPVVLVALAAVVMWLPESRASGRARIDGIGIATSSVAMTAITYGVIEAGGKGWTSWPVTVSLAAGVVILVLFLAWEQRLSRKPGREPLVDLTLFRSASFTWGAILATTVTFALFGLLFAVPQYLQAVRGQDAMGAGLRLLPMVGGLLVGAAAVERFAADFSAKTKVTAGFALIAVALATGATSKVGTSSAFLIVWVGVLGIGLGLALPTSMNAALNELPTERSAVGSAVVQAIRQIGATFGVAVLGTIINSAYHSRLALNGLPPAVVSIVRSNVSSGVAIARKIGDLGLVRTVESAFVHGMDTMLAVGAAIAAASTILALIFLPRGSVPPPEEGPDESPRAESAGIPAGNPAQEGELRR